MFQMFSGLCPAGPPLTAWRDMAQGTDAFKPS